MKWKKQKSRVLSCLIVPLLVLKVQETLSCYDVCRHHRAFHLIMSTLQSATA